MKAAYFIVGLAAALHAETGASAWLRYAALDDAMARQYRDSLPAVAALDGAIQVIPLVHPAHGNMRHLLLIQVANGFAQ